MASVATDNDKRVQPLWRASLLDRWASALARAYGEPRRARASALFSASDVLSRVDAVSDVMLRRSQGRASALVEAALARVTPDDRHGKEGEIIATVDDGTASPEAVEAAVRNALRPYFSPDRTEGSSLRQAILDRVECGDMRPVEAEAWARRFGWPAFAAWADPARFDPRHVASWSLPQVACWIAAWIARQGHEADIPPWLEPDAIFERMSRLDPARQRGSARWAKTEDGHELRPREDRGFNEPEDSHTDAKAMLHEALRAGRVVASGVRAGSTVEIAPDEWTRLKIVGFEDDDGVFGVSWDAQSSVANRAPCDMVRIARDDVLAVWPAHVSEAPTKRPRGRPASITEQVAVAMLRDMRAGETIEGLPGKELAKRYGAAIATCKKALLGAKKRYALALKSNGNS